MLAVFSLSYQFRNIAAVSEGEGLGCGKCKRMHEHIAGSAFLGAGSKRGEALRIEDLENESEADGGLTLIYL